MAPEIALDECNKLQKGSTILDPMCGSGTTLRMAIKSSMNAIGSDLDPLAVLIATVGTTYLDEDTVVKVAQDVVSKARLLSLKETRLPWIDTDQETKAFIDFWFAKKQINDLRKIVTIIFRDYESETQSFLKIVVSRLIITKDMSASLARDTSHSRPHRISLTNDYDVFANYIKYAKQVAQRLPKEPTSLVKVSRSDARQLNDIADNSIDAVITSPPYLNAIDYMRGNKLSLVWLGYKVSDLRYVRGISIGAEKRLQESIDQGLLSRLTKDMHFYKDLGSPHKGMFERYMIDMLALMKEVRRVLKPGSKATLVVGNSCLRGTFIKNTTAVISAAEILGFKFLDEVAHELPQNMRYLPTPASSQKTPLSKRIRTESILYFSK